MWVSLIQLLNALLDLLLELPESSLSALLKVLILIKESISHLEMHELHLFCSLDREVGNQRVDFDLARVDLLRIKGGYELVQFLRFLLLCLKVN